MHGTVSELGRGNGIPEIDVAPVLLLGLLGHEHTILVVGPARIEEVVTNVAVFAGGDGHWLIHNQQRRRTGDLFGLPNHIQCKVSSVKCGRLESLESVVGVEVILPAHIIG